MKLSPNYSKPIQESITVLKDAGITQFPVDLAQIQHAYSNLFVIRSYLSFMKNTGLSREECEALLQSEDGATVIDSFGRYIIYFNDKNSRLRNRFTLAHEMGHIFLDHHFEYGTPVLDGGELDGSLYKRLENEANCFARNLLCPLVSVNDLFSKHDIKINCWYDDEAEEYKWDFTSKNQPDIYPVDLIEACFAVSEEAANSRISFIQADEMKSRNYKYLFREIKNIEHQVKWVCRYCRSELLAGSSYCSTCGARNIPLFDFCEGKRYHRGIKIKNNKYEICPVCGEIGTRKGSEYCTICGSPLMNVCCSDASHINHPEANFCALCGNETIFKKKGLTNLATRMLKKGAEYPMKYNDGFAMDDDKRVLICPKCNNEEFDSEAKFCRICGSTLFNYCNGEDIIDSFGQYRETIRHKNGGNSRYCEKCGAETTFLKLGYLRPWDKVRKEISEEG